LIQQGLKEVIVGAIDQRHRDSRVTQRVRTCESAESRADDDDLRQVGRIGAFAMREGAARDGSMDHSIHSQCAATL
jgi:hypothetical protein